jgi:hypothetical protein
VLIVDTSVLFEARSHNEAHHRECRDLLRSEERLVVPAPVVAETCWMLRSRIGTEHEVAFLDAVIDGAFEVVDLVRADYTRTADLVDTYENLSLGFVDAAIVAVAERMGITRVATLNHRDFAIVRPSHAPRLTLVPERSPGR